LDAKRHDVGERAVVLRLPGRPTVGVADEDRDPLVLDDLDGEPRTEGVVEGDPPDGVVHADVLVHVEVVRFPGAVVPARRLAADARAADERVGDAVLPRQSLVVPATNGRRPVAELPAERMRSGLERHQ